MERLNILVPYIAIFVSGGLRHHGGTTYIDLCGGTFSSD